MALSRTTRVNLLISNGHFLSHFYVLVLPTMFLTTAGHDAALLSELRELAAHSKIKVFDPVHRATAFDKANASGKSTLELYPETKGVDQYRLVADKIISYAA